MELESLPGCLYLLLVISAFIQLIYYLFVYRRLSFFKNVQGAATLEQPVSVIIAARNEAGNLRQHIPLIMEQDYPNYEVIVANDCSYDDTGEVLQELKARYPRLRVVEIPDNEKMQHGKKFALTMAVKAASNEILLFTDADCRPASGQWIRQMQQGYTGDDTEIVLGVSPYEKHRGLLNAFIRYETFYTALNYLSFALAGMPYMGVGRNLSYKKALFFRMKGFASHLHLRSGDDDLFVNKAAKAGNTQIVIAKEAHTLSAPECSWGSYFRQKRRHQSVGKYYRAKHKWLLSLNAATNILFYGILIALLAMRWDVRLLGIAAGAKLLMQYLVYRSPMKRTGAGDLWLFLPLIDLFYHIYIVVIQLFPLSAENMRWKS